MTEKRYSLVVIGVSVALALGIGFFALVSGLFLGYQWGKSAGKAEIIEELPGIGARGIGPLLEEFMPRGGLEQLIPRGNQDGLPFRGGPYLGVAFRVITPELRDELDLDEEHGALVVEVVSNSPADDAGLQEGDIIHAVDGAEVNENHHLAELIGSFEPGQQIELTVIRNGRSITVEVELGTRPGGSSLDGEFLGRFLGQVMPGFQFQWQLPEGLELPEGFRFSGALPEGLEFPEGFEFEYPCGDETCRFPEDFEGFEGFEDFEG